MHITITVKIITIILKLSSESFTYSQIILKLSSVSFIHSQTFTYIHSLLEILLTFNLFPRSPLLMMEHIRLDHLPSRRPRIRHPALQHMVYSVFAFPAVRRSIDIGNVLFCGNGWLLCGSYVALMWPSSRQTQHFLVLVSDLVYLFCLN